MDWAPTTSNTRLSASTQQPAYAAGAVAAVAAAAAVVAAPLSEGANDAAEAESGSPSQPIGGVTGTDGDHSLEGHAYTGHSDCPSMYSPNSARPPLPGQVASDFTTAAGHQIFVAGNIDDEQTQVTQRDSPVHTSRSLVSLCSLR